MKSIEKVQNILPLSAAQKSMLFQYLCNPSGIQHYEIECYEIKNEYDENAFIITWDFLIERYEVLRSVIYWKQIKKPIQIIYKHMPLDISRLSIRDDENLQSNIKKYLENDRTRGFRLDQECFRISVIAVSSDRWFLTVAHHHILFDGWSNAIIMRDFIEIYNSISKNKTINKIKTITAYSDYLKEILFKRNFSDVLRFWKDYLEDYQPLSLHKGTTQKISSSRIERTLSQDEKIALNELSISLGIPYSIILYSTWALILCEISGQMDIVFGITLSGRKFNDKSLNDVVGMLVNTLPLRIIIDYSDTYITFITKLYDSYKRILENDIIYMWEIVEMNNMNSLIFDTAVNIQNYPLPPNNISDFHIELYDRLYAGLTALDLGVRISKQMTLDFGYNDNCFSQFTVHMITERFINIIKKSHSDKFAKISDFLCKG